MKNSTIALFVGVFATLLGGYCLGRAHSLYIKIKTPTHTVPVPVLAASTDVPDNHDVFTKKNDAWMKERSDYADKCYAQGGVPAFTFGLRVFCVDSKAILSGGPRGLPDRSQPRYEP